MPSVFLIFTVFSSLQISECCLCAEYVPVSSSDPSLIYFFALIFSAFCFSLYLPLHPALFPLCSSSPLSLFLDSFTITFCLRALLCDWCGHLYSVGSTKKMERKVCVHVCVNSGGLMVPNVWPTSTDRRTDRFEVCEVCVCVTTGSPYERPQLFPYIWSNLVIGPCVETFLPAAVYNVKNDPSSSTCVRFSLK